MNIQLTWVYIATLTAASDTNFGRKAVVDVFKATRNFARGVTGLARESPQVP